MTAAYTQSLLMKVEPRPVCTPAIRAYAPTKLVPTLYCNIFHFGKVQLCLFKVLSIGLLTNMEGSSVKTTIDQGESVRL